MRKWLAIPAVLIAAMATSVSPNASAITGNYEKDFEHDFVGLLVFYTTPDPETGDPFSHRCSGSLLADRVTVVTAGHCTEGVDEGRMYFQQSVAPNYDPEAFGGWGGDETTGYPYEGGVTFSIADNYGFHNFEGFPENRDVGVVVLDEPYTTPSGDYGILPEIGAVDEYADAFRRKQNVRFTSSGYGLSAQRPVVVSFRERLTATSYLVNNKAPITKYNLKTTANPAQGKGGTCNGDSGGPIFFYGTNVIAAVTSFGNNAVCKGLDFSYRLDREPVLDWILDPNRVDAG
jgi:V8-like Glu-specific endopeptidase